MGCSYCFTTFEFHHSILVHTFPCPPLSRNKTGACVPNNTDAFVRSLSSPGLMHKQLLFFLLQTEFMRQKVEKEGWDTHLGVWGRGVDSELFSPSRRSQELRRKLGIGPNDVAALWLGRVVHEKQPAVWLRVCTVLYSSYLSLLDYIEKLLPPRSPPTSFCFLFCSMSVWELRSTVRPGAGVEVSTIIVSP